MAHAAPAELQAIASIAARRARLVGRLEKFSFPLVAAPLAGLLTRSENHTATARIEALIHLAALACRGDRKPELGQLHEWLNVALYDDPITELEVPVEDVFVSNVDAWFGNARLFSGRWQNNAEHVRACVETLIRNLDRPWTQSTLGPLVALLRVSEALAARTGSERYAETTSGPGEEIVVDSSTVAESSENVSFSDEELAGIGVGRGALDPFVFQAEHANLLVGESLAHSTLERRPLVRFEGRTTVVLPTAIGAAIRRFTIERASRAGELGVFQSTCHLAQFTEVFQLGRPDWEIDFVEMLEPDPGDGIREFIGSFDDGGAVHLVFVPDDFEVIAKEGLSGTHQLEGAVRERMQDRAAAFAAEPDCRRGLTVLVHGGIGREFYPVWGDLPTGWHQLCVSVPDFLLLGAKSDFTAMRAWKLLQQVDDLEAMGADFSNPGGFFNLMAFADQADFELVPGNMRLARVFLCSDFMLLFRHAVRTALDRHASMGPDGSSWIGLERRTTDPRPDDVQGCEVFVSPVHRAKGEVLACVESASRPWWVQCADVPEAPWHRGLAFNVLDLILGWLGRLVPLLEERCATHTSGPVAFRIRFSEIEAFSRRDAGVARSPPAPGVSVEDGQIVIDCTRGYLRSFLSPGNRGDRLMIASLVRGVDSLCGKDAASDAAMEEWVEKVVGSDRARFLKMTPIRTPEDVIYDAVALPTSRLPMPEDLAWSRLDLCRRAGYKGDPGAIAASRAGPLLHAAVDAVWQRVRSRLAELSRESVIERALVNYVALRKEDRDWLRATSARVAVYDGGQVLSASNERVVSQDKASLACRVIAEMAVCTSPLVGGSSCSGTDLDFLIAEVWTLVECASQCDALHYGLAARPPVMLQNGSFEFDASVAHAMGPVMREQWRRRFRDAARAGDGVGGDGVEEGIEDPGFPSAFLAEFGLTLEQYAAFVEGVTMEAVETGEARLRLRRNEVVKRLRDTGAIDPERAFAKFVLAPRAKWDESQPRNAEQRDWYPWRFNRQLSIMRRPLVQLSREEDPVVIVVPSILAGTLNYVGQAAFGELPETLFDSREMIACVGRAAERNGYAFARRVAKRLRELEWQTAGEVRLTELGGGDSLGDVDVLAWKHVAGLVYAIECKSLRFDRTVGEVGERLAEYSVGTDGGKRTDLQKHLDRMSFLEANRKRVANFTGIAVERLELRSALVTENLASMQFGGAARERLDLVTDYELLGESFGD